MRLDRMKSKQKGCSCPDVVHFAKAGAILLQPGCKLRRVARQQILTDAPDPLRFGNQTTAAGTFAGPQALTNKRRGHPVFAGLWDWRGERAVGSVADRPTAFHTITVHRFVPKTSPQTTHCTAFPLNSCDFEKVTPV